MALQWTEGVTSEYSKQNYLFSKISIFKNIYFQSFLPHWCIAWGLNTTVSLHKLGICNDQCPDMHCGQRADSAHHPQCTSGQKRMCIIGLEAPVRHFRCLDTAFFVAVRGEVQWGVPIEHTFWPTLTRHKKISLSARKFYGFCIAFSWTVNQLSPYGTIWLT